MKTVIRHLRRAALLQEGSGPTDEHLLGLFLAHRDEAAFEVLMRRHGPMVLGVCRRVLRNAHDAEDAFQATFLVLVRKAGSLRSRGLLANWLYGVAHRTAMKARAMNAKRRTKESRAGDMPCSKSSRDDELLEQLDHELSRLPEKYRVPVILCELEGKNRKEAACLLGIPEGTLSWRLAQAKKMLARRLSPYGTVALMALFSENATSACLTTSLRTSTLKSVLVAGTASAKVLALTEGVMKAMLLSKLKMTMCAGALMVLAGVGATGLSYRATAEEPKRVEYRKVYASSADTRPTPDDLEALRLEIESLRKELRATKERVKVLEEANRRNDTRSRAVETPQRAQKPQALNKDLHRLSDLLKNEKSLTGIEEALRQLLANPENKQAEEAFERAVKQQVTEALEQALKQLKETEKPRDAGPKKP